MIDDYLAGLKAELKKEQAAFKYDVWQYGSYNEAIWAVNDLENRLRRITKIREAQA